MSNKIYRIIGNEGRVTIPHQLRQCAGLVSHTVVSFELVSEDTVVVRREQLKDQEDTPAQMPSLRELLEDAPTLADMIASFMGVLELIKVRKILIEESDEIEDSVHGESTRFFLNPDAPDEQIDLDADFSSVTEEAAATAKQ